MRDNPCAVRAECNGLTGVLPQLIYRELASVLIEAPQVRLREVLMVCAHSWPPRQSADRLPRCERISAIGTSQFYHFSFGQYTANPSTFSSIRYNDFPAVTYSVFRSFPAKTQLVGVSGTGMNAICFPSGLKT